MATYSNIIGRGVETLRLIVTQGSQSTSGNYSNVNWRLELYSPRTPWSNYSSSWSVNIGGVTRSGTRSGYNFRSYSTLTLGSGSVRINHNSNGTKSINSSASFSDPNGTVGSGSVSGGPLTLTTIARASTISSVSNVSINGSNSVSVGIARQSSSFTHDVKFTLGSRTHTITGVGTSTSYAIPTSWLDQLPSVSSRTGTVQITTKSGSTTIGTASKSFTASVPSNVTPGVGTVTTSLTSPSYPSEWGMYVQGKSSVRVNVTGATPGTGSGLKSIAVTVRGATKSRTNNGYLDFPLSQSGETVITTVVTDNRNRSSSTVNTIYVEPYSNPRISSMALERVDYAGTPTQNGGFGLVSPMFSWDSLSGNNTVTTTLHYKQRTSSTWILGGSPTSSSIFVFGDGNISPNSSYDVRLRVTDYFGAQVEAVGVISSAEVIVDFKSGGKGMGIGKVSEYDNTLEVAWDARFGAHVDLSSLTASGNAEFQDDVSIHGDLNVEGPTHIQDHLKVGSLEVTNSAPYVGRTRGSHAVNATSWVELPITEDVTLVLSQPTWYVLSYAAWFYITGGVGEHRVGITVSGATTVGVTNLSWGDTIRVYNQAGTRTALDKYVRLNAGVNNVRVQGYKIGDAAHSLNYQRFQAIPLHAGEMKATL